jgi:hypothetical protein
MQTAPVSGGSCSKPPGRQRLLHPQHLPQQQQQQQQSPLTAAAPPRPAACGSTCHGRLTEWTSV